LEVLGAFGGLGGLGSLGFLGARLAFVVVGAPVVVVGAGGGGVPGSGEAAEVEPRGVPGVGESRGGVVGYG
jgi:hypothetical protein